MPCRPEVLKDDIGEIEFEIHFQFSLYGWDNRRNQSGGGRMARRTQGEKRRQRCVQATQTEWDAICEDADAEGLSISEYVVRVLLDWRELKGSMRPGAG